MTFEDETYPTELQHPPHGSASQERFFGDHLMKPSQAKLHRCRNVHLLLKGCAFEVGLNKDQVEIRCLGTNGVDLSNIIEIEILGSLCREHATGLTPHMELVQARKLDGMWILSLHCIEYDGLSRGTWLVRATNLSRGLPALLQNAEQEMSTTGDMEGLPVPALILGDEQEIIDANRAARHLLAKSPGRDLKDRSLREYIASSEVADQLIDPAPESTYRFTLDVERGVVEVVAASASVDYAGEKATLVFLFPTDLSVSEDREDDRLFEAVTRNVSSVVLLLRASDGTVVVANDPAIELLGISTESVIDQPFSKFVSNEGELERLRDEVLRTSRVDSQELHLKGNKEELCISVSVEEVTREGISHLLLIGNDREKDFRGAGGLSEGRETANKIFHASPAPTVITRESDGMIIEVNEAMSEIIGRPAEDILQKTTTDIGFWESQEDRKQLLREIGQQGPLHDFEKEIEDTSGKRRTILFSIQRVRIEGMNCLLSVGNDITSRKEAARALKSAKEHAEEMVRFRTGILTNVTHEVRTPLTVILGFTTMLRQGVREEYSRFVDLIERSGRRLLLTLDSVLDLAQLESGTLEINPGTYNMADLLSGTIEDLMPRAHQNEIELVTEINTSSAYVVVDFDLFKRVLEHLLDNAIKFTETGTITLRLESDEREVRLHIIDTGIGIREDFLPHIFEAFKQESTGLERSYQGSGLGLTVAKQLVEEFNGTLSVSSEKGEGSTFTIGLPQLERNASRLAA